MAEGECRGKNGHSNNLPACTKVAWKRCRALSALFCLGVARSNCPIAAEVILVRYYKRPRTAQTTMWNHDLCKFSSCQVVQGWTNIYMSINITHPAPAQAD